MIKFTYYLAVINIRYFPNNKSCNRVFYQQKLL